MARLSHVFKLGTSNYLTVMSCHCGAGRGGAASDDTLVINGSPLSTCQTHSDPIGAVSKEPRGAAERL